AKAESLAPNTIYQLHNAVASFFDSCTREAVDLDGNLVPHYRNDNPVAQMNEDDIPQKPDRTKTAADVIHEYVEVERVVEFLQGAGNKSRAFFIIKHLFLLMPLLGLRISEMLALCVSDYALPTPSNVVPLHGPRIGGLGQVSVERQLLPDFDPEDSSTWFHLPDGCKT